MLEGFFTENGYVGLTDSGWMLFATEQDYIEYMREE
jgi:hypothetical protein